MIEQTELPMRLRRRTPEDRNADVARIVAMLADGRRMTAAQICMAFGWLINEDGKREVRKLAELSSAILSYPGSSGYMLRKFADAAELRKAGAKWIAQGTAEIRRGIECNRLAGLLEAAGKMTTDAELAAYLAG
jgi:hypothetical protein